MRPSQMTALAIQNATLTDVDCATADFRVRTAETQKRAFLRNHLKMLQNSDFEQTDGVAAYANWPKLIVI